MDTPRKLYLICIRVSSSIPKRGPKSSGYLRCLFILFSTPPFSPRLHLQHSRFPFHGVFSTLRFIPFLFSTSIPRRFVSFVVILHRFLFRFRHGYILFTLILNLRFFSPFLFSYGYTKNIHFVYFQKFLISFGFSGMSKSPRWLLNFSKFFNANYDSIPDSGRSKFFQL